MMIEEQNILITEACGSEYHKPTDQEKKSGSYYQYQPDYVNDLGLMHYAEDVLINKGLWARYKYELRKVMYGLHPNHSQDDIVHTSPSQKAEAFLMAIGKWKE